MNAELKQIQATLKTIGLYTGAIDGLIGNKTYSAFIKLKEYEGSKQPLREIQTILATARVYFGAIDGIIGNGSISAFNHLMPAPKVTDELLKKIYKNCASGFADYINQNIATYHIKTKADLCAFLANNIHESGGFTKLRENMNYSPKRLLEVFPKYFKNLASATAIANRGPVAIANTVYGGRMGNNPKTDDGFNYRGGGTIHLTGADNYRLCSVGIGVGTKLFDNPDLIVQPEFAMKSALWFWERNQCSRFANFGDFERVCRIINGGTNGLAERIALNAKAWDVLF